MINYVNRNKEHCDSVKRINATNLTAEQLVELANIVFSPFPSLYGDKDFKQPGEPSAVATALPKALETKDISELEAALDKYGYEGQDWAGSVAPFSRRYVEGLVLSPYNGRIDCEVYKQAAYRNRNGEGSDGKTFGLDAVWQRSSREHLTRLTERLEALPFPVTVVLWRYENDLES